jgi:integrase
MTEPYNKVMKLTFDPTPIILTNACHYPIIPNAYLEGVAKDFTTDTLCSYAYALLRWLEWCEDRHIAWETVTTAQVLMFRHSLKMSNRSINYHMRRLVAFYDFAALRGVPSPIAALVRPRNRLKMPRSAPVRPIRLVTQAAVGRFIQGFDKRRDRLIATVMYLCGLRRSEALGLRKAMLEEPVTAGVVALRIRGKGGVIREVEMSTELRDELLGYALGSKGPYVFNIGGKPLHPSTIEKAFSANRYRTGVIIHCHLLRHIYATHRLRELEAQFQGGSGLNSALKLLQVELGHSNIATTSNYLHLADTQEASKSLGNWQNRQMAELRKAGGAQ